MRIKKMSSTIASNIPQVSNIPHVITKQYNTVSNHKNMNGDTVYKTMTYTVTLYDHKATVKTVTNTSTMSFIV